MRVLITGGAGYIGCHVVRELKEAGHTPVVLDQLNWGSDGLSRIAPDVELREGDCRSSRDVIYALEGVDAVIHLAGIVGEQACRANLAAHHTINVEATRTVVNLCTDPDLRSVDDFIFLSSCSVYGNVKGLYDQVGPDTPTFPLSEYAAAKLRSEQIIRAAATVNPHFCPTILRLTTVFGWSPRPRLDLVTNLFAYRAWRDRKINVFGDGGQYRSLIHVKDIARAAVRTLDSPRHVRRNRVLHVGEEANNKTVREIAEIVKAILPETLLEFRPGQPTDRRDYRIDCQLTKNLIGWHAEYSVEEGIRELIDRFDSEDLDWESPRYRNDRFDYR